MKGRMMANNTVAQIPLDITNEVELRSFLNLIVQNLDALLGNRGTKSKTISSTNGKPFELINSSRTITDGVEQVFVNTGFGDIGVILPPPSLYHRKDKIYPLSITKTDPTSNKVIVKATAGATIAGQVSVAIQTPYITTSFISDGKSWYLG